MAENKGYLPEYLIIAFFIQVGRALQEAHKDKMVHGDVSAKNIFIQSDGTVRLGGFGITQLVKFRFTDAFEETDTEMGSLHYLSPELIKKAMSAENWRE